MPGPSRAHREERGKGGTARTIPSATSENQRDPRELRESRKKGYDTRRGGGGLGPRGSIGGSGMDKARPLGGASRQPR